MGLPNYFTKASVLCGSFMLDGQVYGFHPEDRPAKLIDHVAAGGAMSAWNVVFDYLAWNECLVKQFDYPPLNIDQCYDTMAQAAAMNLPQALGKCAEVLGLPQDKQKDRRGKLLSRKCCVPDAEGRFSDDPKDLGELFEYCLQDSVVEAAVAAKLKPLSDFERQVWLATQRINFAGLPVDVPSLKNTQAIVNAEIEWLDAQVKQITKYQVSNMTNLNQIKSWLLAQGVNATELNAEAIEGLLKKELPPLARQVLMIRQAAGKSSLAKIDTMLDIQHEGRIHGLMTYHGASTGRYASKGGLNAQNLPRPTLDDTDTANAVMAFGDWKTGKALYSDELLDAAVSSIRGQISAPAGTRFVCADYSSVENRVGVWLADHQEMVDAFAKGLDEYKLFASRHLYKVPYEQVTKDMRQVAKSAVLGCLFGQGAKGLVEYAKVYGVTLTLEKSQEIVDGYREAYAPVAKLWRVIDNAAVKAVKCPGSPVDAGKVKFGCFGDFLVMKLPSGRRLHWYKPQLKMVKTPWGEEREGLVHIGKLGTTNQWGECKLYGGTLFQSAVQATARDLLVNGVLNLQEAGYEVVLLVHDEVLAVCPDGFGSGDELGSLMCKTPEWAAGLPLAYEAWEGQRYRK